MAKKQYYKCGEVWDSKQRKVEHQSSDDVTPIHAMEANESKLKNNAIIPSSAFVRIRI